MDLPVTGGGANSGRQPPPLITTGPTIVGLVFKDGVIIGADACTIARERERIRSDSNMICCVAGTVTGTEAILEMLREQLNLHNDGRELRLTTLLTLLKSQMFGYEGSTAFLLGGVDIFGPHLDIVHSHGSTVVLPFVTMGSEYIIANDIFEQKFRKGLDKDEGIKLVCQAIRYSCGSNADVFVITRDLEPEYLENHHVPISEMNVPSTDHAVPATGDSSQGSGQSQG